MTNASERGGTIWSFGGGAQSAAIAALIYSGVLPIPGIAVIADTGREGSETWKYLDECIQPRMTEIGLHVHRIPHSYATVDLWSGADGDTVLMPMFSSRGGMVSKFCSQEWKTRPVARFLRERAITTGDMWIGFSTDEMQRCRVPSPPFPHVYPLIQRRMNRGDCIALVERMGWPTPPRSSCWMCPYKTHSEWSSLPNEDFLKAVALEREVQLKDSDLWLHKSCKPLETVNFDSEPDMFNDECTSGMCFT